MKNKTKGAIVKVSATAVCVIPPVVVTFMQFPLWTYRGEGATISGLALCMAMLCMIPFWRHIKEYFKSPAAVVVFATILAFLLMIRAIIDEMITIMLVATASNCVGWIMYKVADVVKRQNEPNEPLYGEMSSNRSDEV